MSQRHSLLERQLRKYFPDGTSERAKPFVEAIDLAYQQFDDDRRMLERSLDLSSQELMQANDEMRAILEAVPDLFLRITREGRIVDCRAGTSTDSHFPSQQLAGSSLQSMLTDEACERFNEAIGQVAAGAAMVSVDYSVPDEKEVRYFEGRLVPIGDEIMVIIRDISVRKRAEERLLHDAIHDALTGLPNRTLFLDRLEQAIRRSKRHLNDRFALLFVDVDRFKVVNDSLGHLAGDELLVEIAKRIRGCIRPADTVARLGGDEFTVLLDDVERPEDAITAAERIQTMLSAPFDLRGREIFTTVSIGIAISAPHYSKPDEILRDADIAMYRVKERGRAGHQVFHPGMHTSAVELMQLESDLRRALDRGEMVLHYQPIVSLLEQRILGFEALMRWNHPQRGLTFPDEFIRVAEETGLIVPLGRWVLREACSKLRQWQQNFLRDDLTISVNLSGRQLIHSSFASEIEQVVAQSGIAPRTLCIEITESMLIENVDVVMRTLARMRAIGVRIHIDDFGTGYSSLSYLHRFPIDTLKIDRSFISHIETADEHLEIVRTIVNLAQNLKIGVIAEGVETEVQRQHLLALGCTEAQGNYFSEAADEQATQTMVGAGHWSGRVLRPLHGPEDTGHLTRALGS